MDNITTIGKCKWCGEKRKVNEIPTSDKGKTKIVLVCDRCLSNEDREIRQMVERREKLDDGTRYTKNDVMKIINKRMKGSN